MLLAGDVGGTKTLIGLFERGGQRPKPVSVHSYETAAFDSFIAIVDAFAHDVRPALRVDAVAIGVAGPVVHDGARLTNIRWGITAADLRARLGIPHVTLLNDLEALSRSVELLTPEELVGLQDGTPDPEGGAAVIAAGTGLGQAHLRREHGRLVPAPSEGGHADFAARTDREMELVKSLREQYGRVEVERVVSGPGLVHLHRFTHRGGECPLVEDLDGPDAAASVSRAALGGRCQGCSEALGMFVSAYGAEAGNLALRALALGGVYIGGGIAPKILPALQDGSFMRAFLAKSPMTDLLSRVPVHVILNPGAGLLGAAARANELAS